MKHVTIYKNPELYVAFPSVTRCQNGDILASFREGARAAHLDTQTRCCLVRSTDDGQTWDPASKTVIYDEGLDAGVGLATLSDGVVIAGLYNMWQVVPRERRSEIRVPIIYHDPLRNYLGACLGNATRRSYDGGHTWSKELNWTKVEQAVDGVNFDSRSPLLEAPDGTLYWWACDGHPWRSERVWLVRSWDRGDSWGDAVLVAADPGQGLKGEVPTYADGINFSEPNFLALEDGRMIAMLRSDPLDNPLTEGYLYQTTSQNWGVTWEPFVRTPMWGCPPHLLKLQSGTVLCTYGHRRPPYGVRACLSHDGGQTWEIEHEIVLRDDGLGRDLGYPCSVQLLDGRILTVYYIYGEDKVRHIAGTFWREEEARQ